MFMSSIEVASVNKGLVKFTGGGFWANKGQTYHAKVTGRGTLFFESFQFSGWDRDKTGVPCIDVDSRRVIITGCDSASDHHDHIQVRLGPSVRVVLVTSNLMGCEVRIVNEAPQSTDVQIGF